MRGKKLGAKERLEKLESDKAERRKIFKELLDHVKAGFSIDCFGPLSDVTIRKYLKVYPEEFIEEEFVEAIRYAKAEWESIGKKQSTGQCLGNSRSWFYNMANRYGWHEKSQVETEHKGQVSVNVISYASPNTSDNKEE